MAEIWVKRNERLWQVGYETEGYAVSTFLEPTLPDALVKLAQMIQEDAVDDFTKRHFDEATDA